jgi:hypothetical protein
MIGRHKRERFYTVRRPYVEPDLDEQYNERLSNEMENSVQSGEGLMNVYSKVNNWFQSKLGNKFFKTTDATKYGPYMPQPTSSEVDSLPEPYRTQYKNMPPEGHFLRSNYVGGHTRFYFRYYVRKDLPTDYTDWCAMLHDKAYFEIGEMINKGSLDVIRDKDEINRLVKQADNEFLQNCSKNPDYQKSSVLRSWISKHIILAKSKLDDLGITNRLKYIDIIKNDEPPAEVINDTKQANTIDVNEQKPTNTIGGNGLIPSKFIARKGEEEEEPEEYECCESCDDGKDKRMCMRLPAYKLRMKFLQMKNK